ncbi:MAG TPA: ABC transporter permease subunit [Actinomycetota bacterium]|nr:ABC transporter permease subunit [Actinomycetota bacterium]
MRWRKRRDVYGDRRASRVVAVTTAKRAARQGALWGLVFGATIATSASAYAGLFPSAASRVEMARSFEGNAAWAALFGPLRRLDTVAGYTAYKSGMTVIILGAIWGLLIATKSLRGEEDAGRWELFLSGQTTRARAAVQAAIGLGAGLVALWVPTALLTAGAGASADVGIGAGAALFFVTALLAPAAMFMAIGMLVGQLAATRRDANLIGGGVLAASYLIRMAADSDPGLTWLRWASPLGWVEQMHPLTGSTPVGFVPAVVLVAVLVVVSIRIAAQRDLGASALASRDTSRPRTMLLGGQAGLTIRLTRPVIAAWVLALIVCGLVFGLVAQAAGTAIRGAEGLEQAIQRLGATTSGAASYLGFVFVVAAGLMAVAVAGQVAATRNEEAAGHLDNLLVRPVARWRWLTFRLAVALGLVVIASLLAGFAAWLGAVSQHADVSLGRLLQAGLNVVPPAVFVLGVGGLVFGLWPRAAIGVAYGLVVWSFIVESIAAAFDSNHWLRDTSPLTHIAPVPAADPNWAAAVWLVALGLLLAAAGVAAFGRRDLVGA